MPWSHLDLLELEYYLAAVAFRSRISIFLPSAMFGSNHFLVCKLLVVDADDFRCPKTMRATRLRCRVVDLLFTFRLTAVSVSDVTFPNNTVPSRSTTVSSVSGFNSISTLPG